MTNTCKPFQTNSFPSVTETFPFNIMYDQGKVTGVLDWGGFSITDPAYDIGNTLVLITIAFKHLAASMDGVPSVDFDLMVKLYLAAYRAHRPLDSTNLDYYRVRRCVMSLAQGVEGQKVWQHPLIVRDLLAYIHDITGIQTSMPAAGNVALAQGESGGDR